MTPAENYQIRRLYTMDNLPVLWRINSNYTQIKNIAINIG